MKPKKPVPTEAKGPVKQPGPSSYGFGGYGPEKNAKAYGTAKSSDKPSSDAKPAKKGWRIFGR